MMTLLMLWLCIGVILMLLGRARGRPSAGMPLAYYLELSLIHTPGAAAYLGTPAWDAAAQRTYIGYQQTIIGLIAFLIGVMGARALAYSRVAAGSAAPQTPVQLIALDKLALFYLLCGAAYFGMGSLFAIPSLGAFVAATSFMLVVGWSLRLWVASQQGNNTKYWVTIAFLPLLPLMTVVKQGFVGFGTFWVMAVLSFASAKSKRRLIQLLIAPFVIFVGLSFFVTYMESRTALRKAIWFEQVGMTQRVERFLDIFNKFQWLDSDDRKQREVIEGRLNQNMLVGYAADRLNFGLVNYAHGRTLEDMLVALVPRAVWPDKPQVGGGGTVVTDYTGLSFANGTSVGAGQVLEFYVNFGTSGVIGGFLIWGLLVGWLDVRIVENLAHNNQKGVLRSYMVCLAFLQPGGNLVEIAVSVLGSAITSQFIGSFVLRHVYRDPAETVAEPPRPRGSHVRAKPIGAGSYRQLVRARGSGILGSK
jgi:hypothetical protein